MLGVAIVPRGRKSEMSTVSSEGPKLSRTENELRKCLGTDTDELLLKSYSCAWQKEILIQGRLYITAHYLCFYSSILGFETKTVINVDAITSIKKEKTAHLFPNAILISTANKKHGFSTFAHRNKCFNILNMIRQNQSLDQPISQELLAAKIKLLKQKSSKSVDNSPLSTPLHNRHPTWQLSVRGNSTKTTDSDSSGNDSPILISRAITPTPISTVTPPLSSSSGTHLRRSVTIGATVPSVTVTIPDLESILRTHDESLNTSSSADSSLFTDATDGNTIFEISNSYSDKRDKVEDLNSDSAEYSTTNIYEMASSNSSGTESNTELKISRKRMSFPRKRRSSTVVDGSPAHNVPDALLEPSDREEWITAGTRKTDCDPLRGDSSVTTHTVEDTRSPPSVLQQILNHVHVHPTEVGLMRLHKALQNWCTPSNCINLLIVISIFLLIISTASMVCRLSYVSPTFQPFIAWQPWCKLCSDCQSSKATPLPTGDVANGNRGGGRDGNDVLWTLEFFEELVKKHESKHSEGFDTGENLPSQ